MNGKTEARPGSPAPAGTAARLAANNLGQLHLFQSEPDPVPVFLSLEEAAALPETPSQFCVVESGDLYELVVSGYGVSLGKKSERIVVKRGRKCAVELPIFRLGEVVVASRGISISTELLEALCRQGSRMTFLRGNGTPFAMLTSPFLSALVEQRRRQMLAYHDRRGVEFAREVVRGKTANQAKLLRYFNKYERRLSGGATRLDEIADRLKEISRKARDVKGDNLERARPELMGLEGAAGRLYWNGVEHLLQGGEFIGRRHRGSTDPFNSALNYGYGILYSQVWGALLNAGLEPFAGFLHTDRPGKPSLVLDLIEEFRQPLVDRVILTLFRGDHRLSMEDGLLDTNARREVASRVLGELEALVTFKGKKRKMRSVVQIQARLLAAFLRGEKRYRAWSFKW